MSVPQNSESDQLARQIASVTGESIDDVIRIALAERLRRLKSAQGLSARLLAIGAPCAALPDVDARSPDEIVGYDENGMW